jgi:hypothetical protein
MIPPTSIREAWALVRRNGDTVGKRPSTRMAYCIQTIAENGRAVALSAYIMNNDMTGWTKHPRRVEFADVIKTWRFDRQPSPQQVKDAKARLPRVTL